VLWKMLQSAKDDPALQELAGSMGGGDPGNAPAAPSDDQAGKMLQWISRQDPKDLARLRGIQTSRQFTYVPLDQLALGTTEPEAVRTALNQRVQKGELFAYFVLGADPLKSLDGFAYVSNNLTDGSLRELYERALTRLVQKQRIADAGIAPALAAHIQETVSLPKSQVDASGAATKVERTDEFGKWAPVGFVYFLWIAIFSIANMLLTSTIEDKSTRVIEVLLSSVSPGQLMAGKVWGIAATGMTIVLSWVGFGLLAAWLAPVILGPQTGGMIGFLIAALQNSGYLVAFILYFFSGYLLYAAVLVAIGSVCNTLKEAQNLMQPVMIVLMVPLVSMVFVTQEPNGLVAKVLSFVPLFTPFTMMNRAGGPPATWEYIATSVLLAGSIWFAFKAAGKVFRVGVLMTGNPPKLKEILGWLRQA
jgi:ABC-2 type transport system permease protein